MIHRKFTIAVSVFYCLFVLVDNQDNCNDNFCFVFLLRYRWAFVGDAAAAGTENNNLSSDFVPHITRIAKLMDLKVIL